MKYILAIIGLFFLIAVTAVGQEIAWDKTTKWKIYAVPSKGAFKFPADTLHHFKKIELDDKTMHEYLKDATIWPKEKYSVWMGSFVSAFEKADGKLKKIIISSYGGFIYDADEKRYYEIPESKREGWYKYINEKAAELNEKIIY